MWIVAIALLAYTLVAVSRIYFASTEVRRCIDARRFDVRPTVPDLPPNTPHEPSSHGYFFVDRLQRFVRWKLADDFTSAGIAITGIELRGPLTADDPDVAPVALALGVARNDLTQHFIGNATAGARLLTAIDFDPEAYYVALFSGVNTQKREVARDYLNKLC